MPPFSKTTLIIPTKPLEIAPATGMIKKIVAKPITKSEMVGVTIISIDSGTILCNCFSNNDNNHTAKITPIIPPCPADNVPPVKILLIGASGFIPVNIVTAPITPPNAGVAPKTLALLIPV